MRHVRAMKLSFIALFSDCGGNRLCCAVEWVMLH